MLLNFIYLLVYALLSPWMIYRSLSSGNWKILPNRLGAGLKLERNGGIWLHGASVGEVSLLKSLVELLEQEMPELPLIISSGTATGYAAARSAFPNHDIIVFPLDFSFICARVLKRLNPRLIVIAESEFWPNFLLSADRRGIPVVLMNGKMSAKSRDRYAVSWLVPRILRRFRLLAMQAEEHAARMRSLGADEDRIFVTGNMKYDSSPRPPQSAQREADRAALGYTRDDIVIIGGSLHEPEDRDLVEAFAGLFDENRRVALIVVPRYPERAAELERRLSRKGFVSTRKSDLDAGNQDAKGREAILIVDTVGQLGRLYAVADIAFVGGSLYYRGSNKGGHNLMEPAVCGIPVIFGPFNYSFKETAEALAAGDAGVLVEDAEALGTALARLVDDPALRSAMGRHAQNVVERERGATLRNYRLIADLLSRDAPRLQGHARDSTMPPSRSDPDTA